MNKKAVMGESILMIYRLVLITFIALVVLGLSAIYYDYYIDVRDVEAQILAKQVVNCLAPDGLLDLDSLPKSAEQGLLDYCGIQNTDRFYVRASIRKDSNEIKKLEHGDSGAMWVKDLFENTKTVERIEKYEPGYFPRKEEQGSYNVGILQNTRKSKGEIFVEVLVQHEF